LLLLYFGAFSRAAPPTGFSKESEYFSSEVLEHKEFETKFQMHQSLPEVFLMSSFLHVNDFLTYYPPILIILALIFTGTDAPPTVVGESLESVSLTDSSVTMNKSYI